MDHKTILILLFVAYLLWVTYLKLFYENVFYFKVTNTDNLEEIKHMLQDNNDANVLSSHMWYNDLTNDMKQLIDIAGEDVRHILANHYNEDYFIIPEMTEVMVSSNSNTNSEKYFFTKHYDGPFFNHPCSIKRVIIAVQGSTNTSTVFNNMKVSIVSHYGCAFDYDRAPHYIVQSKPFINQQKRILIKLHYYKPITSVMDSMCKAVHINWTKWSRDNLNKYKIDINWWNWIGVKLAFLATYMWELALASVTLALIYFYCFDNTFVFVLLIIIILLQVFFNLFSLFFL